MGRECLNMSYRMGFVHSVVSKVNPCIIALKKSQNVQKISLIPSILCDAVKQKKTMQKSYRFQRFATDYN